MTVTHPSMVRLEIPIHFKTGETYQKGTILKWNEEKKCYQLNRKGEVLITIFEDTVNKFPEQIKPIEDE